jgi:acyl phosphate:glycerol-3-phosphate acyltransferase
VNLTLEIVFVLATYLWGSIPYGYLITRSSTGKNILEHGSGNVGSTNVGRIAGKKMAIITQLCDMFKGLLPVAIYMYVNAIQINTPTQSYIYILALSSIIGHNFSIFLKFKGGKGVNTTLGASVLLAPYSVLISVVVYYLVKWRFKFVSIGSMVLGITLSIVELIIHGFSSTFYYLLICGALIILTHRKNIERLLEKRELKN